MEAVNVVTAVPAPGAANTLLDSDAMTPAGNVHARLARGGNCDQRMYVAEQRHGRGFVYGLHDASMRLQKRTRLGRGMDSQPEGRHDNENECAADIHKTFVASAGLGYTTGSAISLTPGQMSNRYDRGLL